MRAQSAFADMKHEFRCVFAPFEPGSPGPEPDILSHTFSVNAFSCFAWKRVIDH